MKSRLRIILSALVAAILAFTFALPILKGVRCTRDGGRFDRTTLTCAMPRPHPSAAPVR